MLDGLVTFTFPVHDLPGGGGETVEQMLAKIKTFDGRQRFYPAGQHPATYRNRVLLDELQRFKETSAFVDPRTQEAIDYHRTIITDFEAAENEAKAEYVDLWVRGWEPPPS